MDYKELEFKVLDGLKEIILKAYEEQDGLNSTDTKAEALELFDELMPIIEETFFLF